MTINTLNNIICDLLCEYHLDGDRAQIEVTKGDMCKAEPDMVTITQLDDKTKTRVEISRII